MRTLPSLPSPVLPQPTTHPGCALSRCCPAIEPVWLPETRSMARAPSEQSSDTLDASLFDWRAVARPSVMTPTQQRAHFTLPSRTLVSSKSVCNYAIQLHNLGIYGFKVIIKDRGSSSGYTADPLNSYATLRTLYLTKSHPSVFRIGLQLCDSIAQFRDLRF